MKKLFILLLFSLLIGSLKAQDNLDSLMNVWNDETQVDTIRLKAIETFLRGGEHSKFYGFDSLDADSAFVLIESMANLAKAKDNKKYEILAIGLKGHFIQTQDYPEAIKLFKQCIEMSKSTKDDRLVLMSTIRLAFGYVNLDPNQAVSTFQEASNLLKLVSVDTEEGANGFDQQLQSYAAYISYGSGYANAHLTNYPEALELIKDAAEKASYSNDDGLLEDALVTTGLLLEATGDFPEAIKFYSESLKRAEKSNNNWAISLSSRGLGNLYFRVENWPEAIKYYTRAIDLSRKENETVNLLVNLGFIYVKQKDYSKGHEHFTKALKISEKYEDKVREAISLIAIGAAYEEEGEYGKALDFSFMAKEILDINNIEVGQIAEFINVIVGKSYKGLGEYAKAISWCSKKVDTPAIDPGNQRDACECLYESYKALNQGSKALEFHEKFLVLADSMNLDLTDKNLQFMEFENQLLADSLIMAEEKRLVEQAHQEEVLAKEKQRNILLGSGVFVLFFAGGLWSRLRYIRRSKAVLQTEKDRSENLLLNILPAEIAEELKANGKAEARDFEMVSILFTDFKEFTQTSEKLSAAELVGEINHCFEGFDAIMEKYGVEKIKTIGDAYMAAGGLPVSTPESPLHTVQAALEMCDFVANRKIEREAEGKIGFEMRCGIHTGPVVAGIVGVKKFQYDIWGDTVNTASRMESNSEVGQVNISQDTYELIKNETALSFEKRSKIEVKGKGEMEMYFVSI